MTKELDEYIAMQVAGANPLAAYQAARSNGIDQIANIRMLRAVYGLSLHEAKIVAVEGDTGSTYNEHEAALVGVLTKVLDDEFGSD